MVSGRVETLLEIPGPSAETVYRWAQELLSDIVNRWILQRSRAAPVANESGRQPFSLEGARLIQAAVSFAQDLRMAPNTFSVVLQKARLAHLVRYAG